MTARRVIDAIETLADEKPEELVLLLISACNQLRAAVDQGRTDVMLLVQLRDHIQGLIYQGPAGVRQ